MNTQAAAQQLYLGTVKGSVGEIRVKVYKASGQLIQELVDNRSAISSVFDFKEFDFSPTTAVNSNSHISFPESASLNQNYPNPFNPETKIEYSVPKTGRVVLKIYNQLGQMVRTLVNQSKPAGEHIAVWDGQDANGLQLASGTYFYQLQLGDYASVKKMIKLK